MYLDNCEIDSESDLIAISSRFKEFDLKKILQKKKKNSVIDDWGVIDINKYKSKKEIFSCLDKNWTRPLHFDAYKIIK